MPGKLTRNVIKENRDKLLYWCYEEPVSTVGPLRTDVETGYDKITTAIVATQVGWYGNDMLC